MKNYASRLRNNQLGFVFATLWVLLASGVPTFAQEKSGPQPSPADTAPVANTVQLTINYGDGVEKTFLRVPWKKGMTILEAMEYARQHPRGIRFEYRGQGSIALLVQIDDLQNGGDQGLNWIFRVNGKMGDKSFAISEIQPGDTILWKFDEYK